MHRADTAKPDIVPLPVAIQRYFEVSLYLLVLTGFGTLASTSGLDFATVVLVGTALLFRGYLFATQRERVHYLLAVLSFVMVLAAAVLTVDSIFLFSLAAFMVVAVVTFVLMEMRHASWRASITAKES